MKNFNIKKRFSESSFLRVFNIIKKNKNTYLYTIMIDFIFIALTVFLGKYFSTLVPTDPTKLMEFFKTSTNLLLFVIIYPIAYYLFIIFLYSIAKLSILKLIKQLYDKTNLNLKGLGKFYLLNILIFLIFSLTALIIFGILAWLLQRSFLKYIVIALLIPFLFFLYSTVNISHTLFISGQRNRLIRKSLNTAFNKIPQYGMFIVWSTILILIYLIFYNFIHLLFRFTLFTNEQILTAYYAPYMKIFSIISLIFLYLVIAFNRIYFYERIDKNVLS